MTTHNAHAPLAPNRSEAAKSARPVTVDELAAMFAADDNPTVYSVGCSRKIAMNARLHRIGENDRASFVGFDYCDRKGNGQTGTADLVTYSKRHGYAKVPTVFAFERLGEVVFVEVGR